MPLFTGRALITLEQLPEGAKYLPQGGVVRVMELAERGSAKPGGGYHSYL